MPTVHVPQFASAAAAPAASAAASAAALLLCCLARVVLFIYFLLIFMIDAGGFCGFCIDQPRGDIGEEGGSGFRCGGTVVRAQSAGSGLVEGLAIVRNAPNSAPAVLTLNSI